MGPASRGCLSAAFRRLPQTAAQYQAGFAIEDFSALRYVRDMLGKPGMSDLCEDLDLIADPDDPRDLYGMVQRHGSVSVAA